MIKYSRQRESILSAIADRTDHPTADTIYVEIREEYPNISKGTVTGILHCLPIWA